MEHEGRPLPIDHRTLGEHALKYNMYAKALHYKELEYFTEPSPKVLEALISINTKLQQYDAAWGTLSVAREQYEVKKSEEWFERLGHWQDALAVYEEKAIHDPGDPAAEIGRMRCLQALGEWDQLAEHAREHWNGATLDYRQTIAPMATSSAWALNQWDIMDEYAAMMEKDSPDRFFYRAALCVHRNQFRRALKEIAEARELLAPELGGFVTEGFSKSNTYKYVSLVRYEA